MRKLYTLVILLIALCLTSCDKSSVTIGESKNKVQHDIVDTLLIDLKGEVVYPGIYSIQANATLIDLVRLAGGFTKNADVEKVNLTLPLSNNMLIIIPKKIESIDSQSSDSLLININNATISELCKLPGIGTSKAQKIIEYRNKIIMFTSIEQIKEVSGIGEELYSKIKDYICI